ncbi:MAG TPA: MarR family winged helix-turn-helix transcriptional regulator [Stellaceae bacterium]|nr:MarR family winged helix-turn-helix transcriptional regulator [Stellaceae bacterium]
MAKAPVPAPISFPGDIDWRRRNTSRLLYSAAWLFDQRILAIVNAGGFPEIRMAHLHLPRNLDLEGTRLTVLAKRAEMSKQAMAELVDDGERMRLVARRPDPADRRAKIVVFTPRGRRLIEVVQEAVTRAEAEMRGKLGAWHTAQLIRTLLRYCAP